MTFFRVCFFGVLGVCGTLGWNRGLFFVGVGFISILFIVFRIDSGGWVVGLVVGVALGVWRVV